MLRGSLRTVLHDKAGSRALFVLSQTAGSSVYVVFYLVLFPVVVHLAFLVLKFSKYLKAVFLLFNSQHFRAHLFLYARPYRKSVHGRAQENWEAGGG